MADSKSHPEKKQGPISVAVSDIVSDDYLDEMLKEEDPEFLQSLDEIGADKSISISQIDETSGIYNITLEKAEWSEGGKIRQTILRIFPFAPYVSLALKKSAYQVRKFLRAEWVRINNFLYFLATDGKKKFIDSLKSSVHSTTESISGAQKTFRRFSWKMKLAFFGILVLLVGTGAFIYLSLTRGILPRNEELFLMSFEDVATDVQTYDPQGDVEPFYENLRASVNVIQMPKMVVNLKPSTNSGSNPMGAFEFYLEGSSAEVTIEIKDREIEFRDLMQRTLEDFNFDQVYSADGKEQVCEKLKKEINQHLTTGQLKAVRFKTVIVKP